ncbi:MAG: hypothetical protein HY537_07850 [Deltaproteobacteria bacterium]|nr:hypothetical protein [Deltaproteobacteria bacterium]
MRIVINLIVVLVCMAWLSGCSSHPELKTQQVDVEKPQFKVREAAPGGREGWLDHPQLFAEEKGLDKELYYYAGEGKSADKRLACEKAHANISDDIARQVALFVDTSVARATSESQSSDTAGITANSVVSEETQRISSQLAKTSISNISSKRQYWENRDYSEAGGARSLYFCWILGAVAKKDVNSMVVRANTLRLQQSPELKEKVEGKLQNLAADYEKYQQTH